ncbi:hypothetical protein PQR66_11535 [Paraburkholderia agricolaris]|uniref:DUF3108 domain-containing protein n=1 Tax=Paraburkholderia agricolaris TaxID=2152888 RepID=A0ABW8ZKB2_9BURK
MPLVDFAASAVIAASAAGVAGASLPPPVVAPLTQAAAPTFRVGEEWEFVYENELDRSKSGRYTQRVENVGPNGTQLAVLSDDHTRNTFLDASVNVVQSPTGRFTPSTEALRFPLFVGKSWTAEYTFASGAWTSRCERSAKVTAIERVSTPAGTFDAFRVESATTWAGMSIGAGSGRSRSVDWYAPAVGRVVKEQYEDLPNNKNAPRSSSSYELVRYLPVTLPSENSQGTKN